MLYAGLVGLLGGLWHLWITLHRARAVGRGRPELALLSLPLGLLGPAAAVGCSLWLWPDALWAVLVGLLLARILALRPLAARLGAS